VDPPVYLYTPDLSESPLEGIEKVCDSLNHFLVTFCLREAIFSASCLISVKPGSSQDFLAVEQKALWLGGVLVETGQHIDFFAIPEADAICAGRYLGSHLNDIAHLFKKDVKYRRSR
jgi:hypothetical protein